MRVRDPIEKLARAICWAVAQERAACAEVARRHAGNGDLQSLLAECRDSEYGAANAALSIAAKIEARKDSENG